MQKHAGEITVRFDSPLFDYMYQKAYSAQLILADVHAELHADTPLGTVNARVFASADARTSARRRAVRLPCIGKQRFQTMRYPLHPARRGLPA